MIQICSECKIVYGEKEPFEDKRLTHGYCPGCFKVVMSEIKNTPLFHCSHSDGKVPGLATTPNNALTPKKYEGLNLEVAHS